MICHTTTTKMSAFSGSFSRRSVLSTGFSAVLTHFHPTSCHLYVLIFPGDIVPFFKEWAFPRPLPLCLSLKDVTRHHSQGPKVELHQA